MAQTDAAERLAERRESSATRQQGRIGRSSALGSICCGRAYRPVAEASSFASQPAGGEHAYGVDDSDESDVEVTEFGGEKRNQFQMRGNWDKTSGAGGGGDIATRVLISNEEPRKHPSKIPPREGWLEKNSPSWWKGWQSRWFALRGGQLRWYKNENSDQELGILDFTLIPVVVEALFEMKLGAEDDAERKLKSSTSNLSVNPLAAKELRSSCTPMGWLFRSNAAKVCFRIRPVGFTRAFELQVENSEAGQAWVVALVDHIEGANAPPLPAELLPSGGSGTDEREWWRCSRISPERFEEICDTGDVLLFRTDGAMPKLIRTWTKGKYDHVALVMRLPNNEVGLLEATGNEGVNIVPWRFFTEYGWYKLYPRLALRRVHFERTTEKLSKLEEWMRGVVGKPYNCSLGKLFGQRASAQLDQEDFFCSQLVAQALKEIDIIPHGVSSNQYYPAAFSATYGTPLRVTDPSTIHFDRDDLVIDFNMSAKVRALAGQEPGADDVQRDGQCTLGV